MKNRRFLIVLLPFLAAWPCLAAITVQVGNFNIPASQSGLTVPVTADADLTFASFQCNLRYNQNVLKLVSAVKGDLIPSFSVMNNSNTAGVVRLGGFDPALKGVTGAGTLFILTFNVIGQGTSALLLQDLKLSDVAGKALPCTGSSGTVQVGDKKSETPAAAPEQTPSPAPPVPSVSSPRSGGAYTRPSRTDPAMRSRPSVPSPVMNPDPAAADSALTPPRFPGRESPGRAPSPSRPASPGAPASSSGSVVLFVKSDYGKPSPPVGITSFNKGDRAECRVETEIYLNAKEKMVCIGYDGDGSVSPGDANTASFVINADSTIAWKWEKQPAAGKPAPPKQPVAVNKPAPEKHLATIQAIWSKNKKECTVDIAVQPEKKTSVAKEKISSFQIELNFPSGIVAVKDITSGSTECKIFKEIEKKKDGLKITGSFMPSCAGEKFLRLVFTRKKTLPKNFAVTIKTITLWNDSAVPLPVIPH